MRSNNRHLFSLVLAAMIGVTWLTLTFWSLSPYEPYLSHELLDELHFSLSSEYLGLLLIFIVGWTLMTIAMMLPTSLPLVVLFRRLTHQRADRTQLLLLLLSGYLGIWVLFGGLAHLGDLAVHELVEHTAWLEANSWAISVGILLLAGLFQFSSLKYRCLDRCRSPLSFITEYWGHGRPVINAFRLGVHHGLFCLGCCWSLMLLMFALACGNIVWMLGLGTIMAVEKNMPWGRHISAPLGWILLGTSGAVLALALAGYELL